MFMELIWIMTFLLFRFSKILAGQWCFYIKRSTNHWNLNQWTLHGSRVSRESELRSVPYNHPGERGGSVVECRTPEREVRGSRPTTAVLCPWARHFTPRKYWLITQEAMAPSRYDWKIVDWDVKPQHNQPTNYNHPVFVKSIVKNVNSLSENQYNSCTVQDNLMKFHRLTQLVKMCVVGQNEISCSFRFLVICPLI